MPRSAKIHFHFVHYRINQLRSKANNHEMKKIFLLFLAVTTVTVIVAAVIANHKNGRAESVQAPQPVVAKVVVKPTPVLPPETTVAEVKPVQQMDTSPAPKHKNKKPKKQNVSADGQPLTINGYVVQDPDARAALSSVGSDPNATAYWASAINDPNLPSEERKDLIEDLNEDGFSDPKHPGAQDVPLIMNRLQLIEDLAPNAMDPVDSQAFGEAYKDLVAMLNNQPPQ
jgi:hypothetical protein